MKNYEYIRWIGRTNYDANDKVEHFYFTASGFEITVMGSRVEAIFKSTKYDVPDKRAYLTIMIDTIDPFDKKNCTCALDEPEKEIVISNLDDKKHTIRFIKRSEASDSAISLLSIDTDGHFVKEEKNRNFKMQFIAASSSTGYGNLGNLSTPKSTANSDGLKGFAYLTAYMLNAEIDIFSASGWGVTRGWNTGGQLSAMENIAAAYDYLAINDQNAVDTSFGKWDHSRYIPDVVVVNLGTNDFNSCNYELMTKTEKETMEMLFITQYSDFLCKLAKLFPDALVIAAYGLMGDGAKVGIPTAKAVKEANTKIGSNRIRLVVMESAGSNNNQYGSDYHPNIGTGINVARALAKYISDQTGRKIANEINEKHL